MRKLTPLHDRVIIKRDVAPETQGGIVIPEKAKQLSQTGTVQAAGPGKRTATGVRPLEVKAGDRVVFSKMAGAEISVDGESMVIMREEEILGVLEPQATSYQQASGRADRKKK